MSQTLLVGDAIRRRGWDELARAVLWTAGVLGGLAVMWSMLSRPARQAVANRTTRRLASLREAILGNTKASVATVFGPPPTAQIPVSAAPNSTTLFQADTWYYPLDTRRRRAMAIEFDSGLACDVKFIDVPRRSSIPSKAIHATV